MVDFAFGGAVVDEGLCGALGVIGFCFGSADEVGAGPERGTEKEGVYEEALHQFIAAMEFYALTQATVFRRGQHTS